MCRWRVGTAMPALVSVSTRFPISMKAERGWRRPAIRSSKEVLPAPEGPKMPVTGFRISASTWSSKWARANRMFFNRSCIRLFGGGRTLFSTDKPFATPDRDKGERDGNCEQLKGAVIISELDGIEDGQREGGGFAGDIACL